MATDLIVHSTCPYNAEPSPIALRERFITPVERFYVRSHGDVPRLDAARHVVRVDGLVATGLSLSVAALRERFAVHSVQAVMQCAGNRRADLQPVRTTSGDPWGPGAIGNAEWTGVRLMDLLRAAGAGEDASLHVAFDSCDVVELPGEGRFTYGVSIPMDKALSPEVLVAWAMNGAALTPEHGAPLRMVVPGYAGVRSPKWLSRITVRDRPSENHMQARDYRLLPATMTAETADWEQGFTINDMPLNSAICEPASGDVLSAGAVAVRGYAIATARAIVRVEVSMDGGQNWVQAELEREQTTRWSWMFWNVVLTLPVGRHELVVRAWDEAGQTQPARAEDVWNCKGYLSAAWHRVEVLVR